jgi:hypothetical protein
MFFQMFWVKIEISGDTIGTVIVFDKDNIDKVVDEYRIAEKAQTRITIRPVFAGKHSIDIRITIDCSFVRERIL